VSAEILSFRGRNEGGSQGGDPLPPSPLIFQVRGALNVVRLAQEEFAKVSIDRRRTAARQVGVLLDVAADTLEKAIATYAKDSQRELAAMILESLGPDASVDQVNGARNMLEAMLRAVPDWRHPPRRP
jgi:hypothetical protein